MVEVRSHHRVISSTGDYIPLPGTQLLPSACVLCVCVCGLNSKDTEQHTGYKPPLIFVTCLQLNSVDMPPAWYSAVNVGSCAALQNPGGTVTAPWLPPRMLVQHTVSSKLCCFYQPHSVCFCSLSLNFIYEVKNLFEGSRKLWKKDQHSFIFYVYLPSDSCSV